MIKFITVVTLSYTILVANVLSPYEIMNYVYQSPKPKTSIMEIKLEITRLKKGREKVKTREFIRYTKLYDSGKFVSKSLAKFSSPKIVKGTGLLSWVYRNGETDQWFFLPKLKKAKRIEAKEKSKTFLNTDFIYEDLESTQPNNDSLVFIGNEYFEGNLCNLIMSWPKNNSSYFSKKIWVNTQNWQIIKVEFYKSELTKDKTLYLKNFIEKDTYLTPGLLIMQKENGNKTIMEVKSFQPNIGLNEEVFSNKFLMNN